MAKKQSSPKQATFSEMELLCFRAALEYACRLMEKMIGHANAAMGESYKEEGYEYAKFGTRKTTIKTMMGPVTVVRAYCRRTSLSTGEEEFFYPLDEYISSDSIGLVSKNLAIRCATAICEMSYRETAGQITTLTGQDISWQTVWTVVQELAGRLRQSEMVPEAGEKRGDIKVLYEEADGVWISLQGADRKKLEAERKKQEGNRKKQDVGHKRKPVKAEMKVAVDYTGWDKIAPKRFARRNPQYVASFDFDDLLRRKEARLNAAYDMDEVVARMTSGDGASWVRDLNSNADETVFFQLDQYHINSALKKANLTDGQYETVLDFLRSRDYAPMLHYIRDLIYDTPEGKDKERLIALFKYYANNRKALTPIIERPECQKYLALSETETIRRLGTMESTICNVITMRMKHRKMSFSIKGASNLATLLCYKREGVLEEKIAGLTKEKYLSGLLSELLEEDFAFPSLSAGDLKKPVGKGSEAYNSVSLPIMNSNSSVGTAIRAIIDGYKN
jgi:hypothetical protein